MHKINKKTGSKILKSFYQEKKENHSINIEFLEH